MPDFTGSHDPADAEALLAKVQGEIAALDINPAGPASLTAVLQRMESIIDDHLGGFGADPVIGPVIAPMKERYRRMIAAKYGTAGPQSPG